MNGATMNNHQNRNISRQKGFTIIEAMIALIVVAFGMLALAGMQMILSRGADLARQRNEATRLADEKIEQLRAFNSIEVGTGLVAWDSLASGSETLAASSNTTFTRTWTLGGTAADSQRTVRVQVTWVDRAGVDGATASNGDNKVILDSFIAKADPALSGALGFPLPGNGTIKRPKNRNLNIPIQAIDLGQGSSVVNLSSTFAIIFDNNSGYVVKRCGQTITTQSQVDAYCNTYPAYILAGYISGTMTSVTGVNLGGLTGSLSHGGADCVMGPATNQNTGAPISGYKYYLCVIQVASSGAPWSGKVLLTGMASGTNYTVCRFQYAQASLNPNENNVQPYSSVTESLDQQNYVLTTSASCPTVGGLLTTSHQRCVSSNVDRATECPALPD